MRAPPDLGTPDVAFAVTCAARLADDLRSPARPHCFSDEAAGFTSCCGPRSCSLRRGSRRPARAAGISPRAWGLLPGALALTRTGLAPAGDVQREAVPSPNGWGSRTASSRRTRASRIRSRRGATTHVRSRPTGDRRATQNPRATHKPCARRRRRGASGPPGSAVGARRWPRERSTSEARGDAAGSPRGDRPAARSPRGRTGEPQGSRGVP